LKKLLKTKKNKKYFLFKITEEDYLTFMNLSGDKSLVHSNKKFCIRNNFKGKVVYGGLLLAKLSNVLSKTTNGNIAISLSWNIIFHYPLYVNDKIKIIMTKYDYIKTKKIMKKEFLVHKNNKKIASINVIQKVLKNYN